MPKKKTKPGSMDDNAIKRVKNRNAMLEEAGSEPKPKPKPKKKK